MYKINVKNLWKLYILKLLQQEGMRLFDKLDISTIVSLTWVKYMMYYVYKAQQLKQIECNFQSPVSY